ncbi:MAG: response regulator [Crinalium sp.]
MDMEFFLGGTKQTIDQRPLVLAVDDDEDNLHLLTYILEVLDCAVITAGNGEDTLALAKTYQPDIILLDIILPDLHGIEVIHRLKQNPITNLIPIIVVSALARIQDRDQAILAGCNEYVTKPFNIQNLENLIRYYFVKSEKFFKARSVTSYEVLVNQPIQQ